MIQKSKCFATTAGRKTRIPCARFTWAPGQRRHGFDAAARPRPWQMVPQDGSRNVRIDFTPSLRGRSVDFTDDSSVFGAMLVVDESVRSRDSMVIALEGLEPKLDTLKVTIDGTLVGALDVSVKEPREQKVAFYELQIDGKSHTKRFTRRRGATDLGKLMGKVNDILQPQANLTCVLSTPTAIPLEMTEADLLTGDVGDRLDQKIVSEQELKFFMRTVTRPADTVMVVLVGEYETNNTDHRSKFDTNAETFNDEHMIVMEDNTGNDHQTLAHELVHYLLDGNDEAVYGADKNGDINVHSKGPFDLMHPSNDGTLLRKREIDVLNATGTVRA